MRRVPLLLMALVVTAAVVEPAHAARPTQVLTAAGNHFAPIQVAMHHGDALRFVNLDQAPHNVTALSGAFKSDTVGGPKVLVVPGVEDLAPGVYEFYCSVHEEMVGSLSIT